MNNETHLSRVLARKDVLALAFGAMIGWGWIVLTGSWIQSAGSLGIVIAYLFVALSFVVLRRNEPEMERPFRVRRGKTVGAPAVILSVALIGMYLPGSPSALSFIEWCIFAGWMLLGLALYAWSRARYGVANSDSMMNRELAGANPYPGR
ncbi:hypothetical protein [Halomonas aquatica]|uniref:Amino acid permease n=1 Tax=Halomonas aquatica TaxID=3151123 RepID=A0ABV1NB30_9GAMM